MNKLTGLGLAALVFAAGAASAQEATPWRPIPIEGGCVIVAAGEMAPGQYRWSAPCAPGQVVDGAGTLTITHPDGSGARLIGTFASGVPNGDMRMEGFGASGELRGSGVYTYAMGCAINAPQCVPYTPPR